MPTVHIADYYFSKYEQKRACQYWNNSGILQYNESFGNRSSKNTVDIPTVVDNRYQLNFVNI